MRLVKNIENDFCNANLYSFNNKFILKFEVGNLEQIYKVSEMDVSGIEDIEDMMGDTFMKNVMSRFNQMNDDLELILDSVD